MELHNDDCFWIIHLRVWTIIYAEVYTIITNAKNSKYNNNYGFQCCPKCASNLVSSYGPAYNPHHRPKLYQDPKNSESPSWYCYNCQLTIMQADQVCLVWIWYGILKKNKKCVLYLYNGLTSYQIKVVCGGCYNWHTIF